jgi:hypothetical protein
MKNPKSFLFLYYISFLLSLFFYIYSKYTAVNDLMVLESHSTFILGLINLILVLIFTISLIKKRKLDKPNLLFPILFLLFVIFVLIICFKYNEFIIIENIHLSYFCSIVLIVYILYNIYALLSLKKIKK